ncbi:hypothetical protein BJY21_002549 [Kineosphaera limosa]|uniref:Uncharacterized protein n=1 Tax=Kineosphaera limosa NBRC 100340 TaxID=1184609 RepID=K6VGZ2_9MICO|nr:cell wall-binding repeat-containing protein [Kineosphaera limosa]NYE01365.1 hypothetical protein [Kineosphaera limosa]GAB95463.1 hypothetical protein KILIM_021_00030 [Kineosphaera limosa NBRC 100340]
MGRKGFATLVTALLVGSLAVLAPAEGRAEPAAADNRPATERLAGASRYETAAAIATRAGRMAPTQVRIVRGDRPLDAVATAGDATPVLYLPPSGPVPEDVRAAFQSLSMPYAKVVGSTRALPTARVRQLIGSGSFSREGVDDPVQLSFDRAAMAASSGTGDDCTGYEVHGLTVTPSTPVTAAAVALQAATAAPMVAPAVLLPPTGRMPRPTSSDACQRYRFHTAPAVIGGPGALSDARVASFARLLGAPVAAQPDRIAGADRYATSALLSRRAFSDGAATVYLAGGDAGPDAAAATGLTDGPVLLVPPCALPREVATEITRLQPDRIVALGSDRLVCDQILQQARAGTTTRPTVAVSDIATSAFTSCALADDGAVLCWGEGVPGANRLILAPRDVPSVRGRFVSLTSTGRSTSSTMSVCGITHARALECLPAPVNDRPGAFTPVPGLADVVDVAIAFDTACAVTAHGRVWCWGSNGAGQLGTGTREPNDGRKQAPTLVPAVGDAVKITMSLRAACALSRAGVVTCWGAELPPDPGAGLTVHAPTTIAGLPADVTDISLGGDDRLTVRTSAGEVLSVAESPFATSRPASAPWATNAEGLTEGEGCALHPDGTQTCLDMVGALEHRRAAGPGRVVATSDGCVVLDSGALACRGRNTGDGTTHTRRTWVTPLGIRSP